MLNCRYLAAGARNFMRPAPFAAFSSSRGRAAVRCPTSPGNQLTACRVSSERVEKPGLRPLFKESAWQAVLFDAAQVGDDTLLRRIDAALLAAVAPDAMASYELIRALYVMTTFASLLRS